MKIEDKVREAELAYYQNNPNSLPKFLIVSSDIMADIQALALEAALGEDPDNWDLVSVEPVKYGGLILALTQESDIELEVR